MKTRAELEHRLFELGNKEIDGEITSKEKDEKYFIKEILNERHDDGHDDDYDDDYDDEYEEDDE